MSMPVVYAGPDFALVAQDTRGRVFGSDLVRGDDYDKLSCLNGAWLVGPHGCCEVIAGTRV